MADAENVRITIGGVNTPHRQGTILLFHNSKLSGGPVYVVARDFHVMPEHAIASPAVMDTLIRLGAVMQMKAGVVEIDFSKGAAFESSTQIIQMQAQSAHKE